MEIIYFKQRKVRKTHTCYGCLNKIFTGEIALVETVANEGSIGNVYTCSECVDYTYSNCLTCKTMCCLNENGEYNEGYVFYCKEDNSK